MAALYDRLGTRMHAPGTAPEVVEIARAFETLPLAGPELCDMPRAGTSLMAGAEDGRSRVAGWKPLGFIGRGLGQHPDSVPDGAKGCHAEKHIALSRLQEWGGGEQLLPRFVQLSAVRIGGTVLATLPAEPTTTFGHRLRATLAAGAPAPRERVVVVAHTNGYLSYLTTPEEYRMQFYEGGSTLYGPGSQPFFQRVVGALAATLPAAGGPSPPPGLAPVTVYHGPLERMLPRTRTGPESVARSVRSAAWRGDTLVVRWIDLHPGRLVPADGPLLAIHDARGALLAWDEGQEMEVRAIRSLHSRGHLWEARWTRPGAPPGRYRVVLLARPRLPEVEATAEKR